MYRILLILYIIWGGVSIASGQDFNYSFTQLSTNQGLSQASVTSVTMDQKGRLWIGTQSGLNYYFQQQLKTFIHHESDSLSLPNNYINHIVEDSLGTIWVATSKRWFYITAIIIISRLLDTIVFILPSALKEVYCLEVRISFSAIIIKAGPWTASIFARRRIWIYPNTGYKNGSVEKNKILIGTKEQGIYLYDCCTQQLTRFTSDIHHLLISLYVVSDKYVYASFYGNGIYCYNQDGKIVKSYTSKTSSLNNNYVLDIIEHKGQLWIATDGGGINILDMNSDQIKVMCHVAGDNFSLPVNSIVLLYEDRNGNLWAGSVRGGIFNIKKTYIRTYKDVALNNSNGLSDKSIISLYEDDDDKLWIGTDGGGINLYDPHTDQFTHFPSTYGDKVASIAKISEKELMVSLYTKGIFIFNKITGTYRPFTIVDEGTNYKECFYGYLPLAHQVANDKIYIISYRPWVYHPLSGKFSLMPTNNLKNTDALRLVYSNEHFSLLKRVNQIFYVPQENDSISLLCEIDPEETITALAYQDSTIWIGTDRGLGCYDMIHKNSTIYIPTILKNIFPHWRQKGRLWICAHNKLFSYLIKEKKFTLWNSSDGFLPNDILAAHYTLSNPNFVYLGGAEGLVKINTNIPQSETQIPQISLADIKFNGCSYLKQMKNQTLHIPWNYNSLTIHICVKMKISSKRTCSDIPYQAEENKRSKVSTPNSLYLPCHQVNIKSGYQAAPKMVNTLLLYP